MKIIKQQIINQVNNQVYYQTYHQIYYRTYHQIINQTIFPEWDQINNVLRNKLE